MPTVRGLSTSPSSAAGDSGAPPIEEQAQGLPSSPAPSQQEYGYHEVLHDSHVTCLLGVRLALAVGVLTRPGPSARVRSTHCNPCERLGPGIFPRRRDVQVGSFELAAQAFHRRAKRTSGAFIIFPLLHNAVCGLRIASAAWSLPPAPQHHTHQRPTTTEGHQGTPITTREAPTTEGGARNHQG